KIVQGKEIHMSISSMRVDAFCPEVVKTLVAAGQKNTTLAIEAGSERLRKVINKNLTEEQIFTAIDVARENGLKGFKFYGMIGLPTETQADLDEMIILAKKIKQKYKGFDISFGFSSFVPKPNTPFQWFGREDTKSLEKKANYLKKELHKIGVSSQFGSIKWDYYQAVLSRGDESFTDFLIEIYNNQASIGAFKSAAKKYKIKTDYYALENYPYDKVLPWNFIEISPGNDFLVKESKQLLLK
ncbi:radical SAM protein, partial [bacterium]|nr:radical SAM protein [bacterium]